MSDGNGHSGVSPHSRFRIIPSLAAASAFETVLSSPNTVSTRAIAAYFPKPNRQRRSRAKPPLKPPRLLRTQDAASYLGISPWTLRNLVRNGDLPVICEREGSPWRFDQRDLDSYIERRRQTF